MGEIKIVHELFENFEKNQAIALKEMESLLDEQKTIFDTMNNDWEGSSGECFEQGSTNLLRQANVAKLTLQHLKSKSTNAKDAIKSQDLYTAQSFDKNGGNK